MADEDGGSGQRRSARRPEQRTGSYREPFHATSSRPTAVERAAADKRIEEMKNAPVQPPILSDRGRPPSTNIVACAMALQRGEPFDSDAEGFRQFGVPEKYDMRGVWVNGKLARLAAYEQEQLMERAKLIQPRMGSFLTDAEHEADMAFFEARINAPDKRYGTRRSCPPFSFPPPAHASLSHTLSSAPPSCCAVDPLDGDVHEPDACPCGGYWTWCKCRQTEHPACEYLHSEWDEVADSSASIPRGSRPFFAERARHLAERGIRMPLATEALLLFGEWRALPAAERAMYEEQDFPQEEFKAKDGWPGRDTSYTFLTPVALHVEMLVRARQPMRVICT